MATMLVVDCGCVETPGEEGYDTLLPSVAVGFVVRPVVRCCDSEETTELPLLTRLIPPADGDVFDALFEVAPVDLSPSVGKTIGDWPSEFKTTVAPNEYVANNSIDSNLTNLQWYA